MKYKSIEYFYIRSIWLLDVFTLSEATKKIITLSNDTFFAIIANIREVNF